MSTPKTGVTTTITRRYVYDRRDLVATLARVEALIGKWEDPGLVCDCGHDLGQHNSGGCYARLSYKPTIVVCSCTETDDRYEDDFAIRDLRAALAPQNHPRNAAHAPEAPGHPGRGERGSGGHTAGECIFAACPAPDGETCGDCHRCDPQLRGSALRAHASKRGES